ncbi:MAG: hypothetical protein Q9207_008278 [Kuettlingeria erythrocarpa]
MDSLAKDPGVTPASDLLPTAEVSISTHMRPETYLQTLTWIQTPLLPRYRPSSLTSAPLPSACPSIGQDQAIDVAHDPPSSHANAEGIPTPTSPADSEVAHCAKRHLFLRTVLLCGFLNLVADLGGNMTAAPEIRILELSLCREYYRAHDPSVIGLPPWRFVDERHCKIAEIQRQLAQLRGLWAPLSAIPGLLFTVFAGSLADVYGRKPLLLWSFTGIFLGSNAPQTLQGLASSFTDGSNTAELYSTLAFAQLVGTMLGGPIAAALFTRGLRLGPDTPWAGLPFYASSVSPTQFPVTKFGFSAWST